MLTCRELIGAMQHFTLRIDHDRVASLQSGQRAHGMQCARGHFQASAGVGDGAASCRGQRPARRVQSQTHCVDPSDRRAPQQQGTCFFQPRCAFADAPLNGQLQSSLRFIEPLCVFAQPGAGMTAAEMGLLQLDGPVQILQTSANSGLNAVPERCQ